jgi:hypothetical protein
MFWAGFFVGVIALLFAAGMTWVLVDMLRKYIKDRVYENREDLGFSKLDIDFLQTDVKYLKNSRDIATSERQELRESIAGVSEVAADNREVYDSLTRKDECLVNDVLALEDMNETLCNRLEKESLRRHEDDLAFDKRIRELQDRIDYFIGISPVGGMLSAKIVQEGIAIHKATDKGAPFDGVTKLNDLVTIYEVKYVNDVQWAKIGENKWICGGWRPRDPKADFDGKG